MIFIILIILLYFSIYLGKYFFRKYINPISIYSSIWVGLLFFFHIKLINYDDLSINTWILIVFSYLSFVLGVLVYFSAIRVFNNNQSIDTLEKFSDIFLSSLNDKILKYLILFFSILGIIGALQHWSILLSKYGSVIEVFLHLGRIRQLTVQGEIKGMLPYISAFSFVAVFFAGLYSALKKRIMLISFLPIVAIIIKDTAAAGRVGILIGFMEFGLTYIFTIYYLNMKETRITKSSKEKYKNGLTISLILIVFFSSIFIIKGLRGGSEQIQGAKRNIQSFSNNMFITPTLYLYFSGHVGVLSKYLEEEKEKARFGENTFRFVYNVLNKIGITKEAEMYQRGYYIPVWINTGTFLRELHADFGIGGTLLFLFLLGVIISFVWNNFYKFGNIYYLVFLVYLSLIISLSFLMMITRITNWTISLLTILITISILKKNNSSNTVLVR